MIARLSAEVSPYPLTVVHVGIGELVVSRDPEQTLAAYGLGSCVAVAAWDRPSRTGGMVHIMLPDSTAGPRRLGPTSFGDTGVRALIETMEGQGASRERLAVKIAGGAQVLSLGEHQDGFAIGRRNIEAVREALRRLGLTVLAEDVGGTTGRTLLLHVATGRTTVQAIGRPPRDL